MGTTNNKTKVEDKTKTSYIVEPYNNILYPLVSGIIEDISGTREVTITDIRKHGDNITRIVGRSKGISNHSLDLNDKVFYPKLAKVVTGIDGLKIVVTDVRKSGKTQTKIVGHSK